MKKMLKAYFGYKPFYFYFLYLFILTYYLTVQTQWLREHAVWLIIIPIINPFFEWFLHKYILHAKVSTQRPWIYKYMRRLHYDHHIAPDEPKLLFAQTTASLSIYIFWFLIFIPWAGWEITMVIQWGVGIAYLYYEWVHLGHHIEGYNHFTAYGKKMRKFHRWHHYKNENYWWGITSHIGDIILGTCPEPREVTKSDGVKNILA